MTATKAKTKPKLTAKKEAIHRVRNMPEESSIREIIDELRILEALGEAEADSVAGRVISHADIIAQSRTWITK